MRKIKCVVCNKTAMKLVDAAVARGTIVRCAKCEEALRTRLKNLEFLANYSSANPLSSIFGDKNGKV